MASLQALPPGVVMSDFWDMSPGAIAFPIWLMVLILLAFVLVASNFWWIYKFLVMRPVQGHGEAARAGNEKTQQVMLFGMNRAFSIQALDYLEKVLSFKDTTRISRWLQTSPYASGMLGKKSIMLISEIFDHPKDPVAEIAIGIACINHNKTVKKMEDMITDYKSFKENRKVLEHENPIAVKIPSVVFYDPAFIFQYTPANRTSGQFGRTILKDANDLNKTADTKSFWEKHMQLFVCVVFAVVMVVITAWFVMNWNPAPAAAAASAVPIPGVVV